MKKSLVAVSILAVSVFAGDLNPYERAFKSGFEYGLRANAMQKDIDGVRATRVNYTKPFVVSYDIQKIPYSEVLLTQFLAHNDGFKTHLTKNLLLFGDFEREADAKQAVEYLKKNFNVSANIISLSKVQGLATNPLLWSGFYDEVLSQAKAQGVIVQEKVVERTVEKVVEKPVFIEEPKKQVKKPAQKATPMEYQIKLINDKAMGYVLTGNSKILSSNYVEDGIKSGVFKWYPQGIYSTEKGEKFVRSTDEIYFLYKDVKIIKR
jgi:hypothetical protein